jgi:hypothetical protein
MRDKGFRDHMDRQFTLAALSLRHDEALDSLSARHDLLAVALDLEEIVTDCLYALKACQARIADLESAQGRVVGRARDSLSSSRARPHLRLVTSTDGSAA